MDTLFFWLSKLIWLLISPDSLIILLTLASFILLLRGSNRYAAWMLGTVVSLMTLIALLPLGDWMLNPLETRYPANPALPNKIDGVILLGGAEIAHHSHLWNQVELGSAAERDLAFMKFLRAYPDARFVFTGGSGKLVDNEFKESEVARMLLLDHGFDISNIIFEDQSRNTYENAKLAYDLIHPGPDENWILITTAWHMPRAMGVFQTSGWPVIAYPVDHYTYPDEHFRLTLNFAGNLSILKTAIKEWIGLAAYWATGKLAV